MYRLIRFLIITFTLGRIRWMMRLTWVWRLVVFLGITGWLARKLRTMIGLDRSSSSDVDSAWADALRYTPAPAGASAGYAARSAAPSPAPTSRQPIEETRSEVTGYTEDGSTETITMHEVSVAGETETIVRIEDEAGNVETLVTDSSIESLDLANLGQPAVEPITEADVIEAPEVEAIAEAIAEEVEIEAILDVLEAAEPEVVEPAPAPEKPKRQRARKTAPAAEPLEVTGEDADLDVAIEPDWVRGDGSDECPESHPIKAKASSMIYYVPESGHYSLTLPDVCFASPEDAIAAGYRAPRRG